MSSKPPLSLAHAAGAILAGNLIYFFLLSPRLPDAWRHQPFAFDRGLALDFLLCLALYLLAPYLRTRV